MSEDATLRAPTVSLVGEEAIGPDEIRDIERKINRIAQLTTGIDDAVREADEASAAAKKASERPTGLFRPNETTKALQDAIVEGAEAIVALAESQKHLFENQQALAGDIRELTAYALKSVGTTRAVYHRLRAMLQEASEGELHELAQRELRRVMLEFRHQLDLAERQELADRRVRELRDDLSSQRSRSDRATEDIAALLKEMHRDLDEHRQAGRLLGDAFERSTGRLDELEQLGSSTVARLNDEAALRTQRDDGFTRQVARLRTQLWVALGIASVGLAVGAGALVAVLLP